MARRELNEEKLYLYAIIPACNGQDFGAIGIGGGLVGAITTRGVSAVISGVSEPIRPERRLLATHQQVLRHLMESAPGVLPVAFGVLADGPEAMRRILSRNHAALLENLRRVSGRVEMGLRIAWDVPNIFEYFVETQAELRAARDRLFGGHGVPTQDDKIVGRLFERLLTEERDAQTARVLERLEPACSEIRRSKMRNEREIANLACLVARDDLPGFEAAVFEAANLFDNNYSFDYNGPWAPHNFVDVSLDLRPA